MADISPARQPRDPKTSQYYQCVEDHLYGCGLLADLRARAKIQPVFHPLPYKCSKNISKPSSRKAALAKKSYYFAGSTYEVCMRVRKRFLILGVFIFLLGFHYLVLTLAGYGWIGGLFLLPEICGFLFLFMMGCGCLLRSFFLRVDRRILEADQKEAILENGSRIAFHGTIEPDRAQLSSPFSGKPCVLYEYQFFRKEEDNEYPEAVGWAFVPSSVRTDTGAFKLLDYPKLMDFPEKQIRKA